MREGYGDLVADVQAFGAGDDFAFDGWVEDADVGAFGGGAGDDSVEVLADLAGEGQRRRRVFCMARSTLRAAESRLLRWVAMAASSSSV